MQKEMPYGSQPVEALYQELQSGEQGLTQSLALARLKQAGLNTIKAKTRVTPLGIFLSQFKSPIVLILIFAALVSAVLNDWIDALIILAIVFSSALLSFTQEYQANAASEKLKAQIISKTTVVRDGKSSEIPSENLVPGDVVLLNAGSLIPADGQIIEANDFFVNQAVLTGETFPVEKTNALSPAEASLAEQKNVVFMGTNVRSGSAKVLIFHTGLQTAFGKIADRLNLRPPETGFQIGIRQLGYLMTQVMIILAVSIFALNVVFHKPVLDSLLFSIALAVGLTPQLLPAIININLSKGSQVMAQHGVIVRRLESIENFGGMDVLCTDKTGTITEGVVSLSDVLNADFQSSDEVLAYASLNAALQTGLSNPLDQAIQAKHQPPLEKVVKIDEVPYDFVRKRLSIIVKDESGQVLMITKGALANVLDICTLVQAKQGTTPMSAAFRAQVEQQMEAWSEQGFRVLGLAVKTIADANTCFKVQDEAEMAFAGFLLFYDPPKADVKQAIRDLAELGVTLKIITGDNALVARHTGALVELPRLEVLSGKEMNQLDDAALWHAVENIDIFADVDPNQKERILLALKKHGHIVGYMGDGINDAPSLHSADVGISVENAVDVAKEAADMMLLKQDLSVLKEGIVQGRKTFANTLKYIFMATSANFGNMFSMAGASLFLPFLPMLPKQILLINFLTDLPEMTIASDLVDDEMVQKAAHWDIGFIRKFMLVFGPISSLFDFATFGLLYWGLHAGEQIFHTGWFVESILSASFVVFVLRTRQPFLKSKPSRLMLSMTLIVAAVVLILPYTGLGRLMGFAPLPPLILLAIIGLVGLYLLFAEIAKHWFYRHFSLESKPGRRSG